MRIWFWIVAVMVLAACANAQTPAPDLPTLIPTLPPDNSTPTGQQATPVPNQADVTTPDTNQPGDDQTESATAAANAVEQAIDVLPPAGTMVAPATQEVDPNAAPIPFRSITYEQSGGPANTSLRVEIFGDGRVLRDGVEISVGADVIAGVEQQLIELDFFAIQGQFTAPGTGSDVYEYIVRVEREDGAAKRLKAQDGLTPPELLRLFSALRNIGA